MKHFGPDSILVSAIQRLSSGLVPVRLWIVAFISHIAAFGLMDVSDDSLFLDPGVGMQALLTLIMCLGLVGVFVTSWKFTRTLAEATVHETGFVGSWLGWGVIAVVPSLLAFALFEIRGGTSAAWWVQSLVVSCATCVTAPVTVHAAGRAINDKGPSLGVVFDYWLVSYGRLFLALFVVTAPFMLVSDGLYEFGYATTRDAILSSFVTTVMFFASTILSIAIAAIAYRETESAVSNAD